MALSTVNEKLLALVGVDFAPMNTSLHPGLSRRSFPSREGAERKRLLERQKGTNESKEKRTVVSKRQLSVHIDFPVLCGVRLGLSCSVPQKP